MHTFADDNTLPVWGETLSKIIDALESESNIAIDSFTKNKIIVNPDIFQAIIQANILERNPILQTFR